MTALGTIVAASPLNANDASRYTGFTADADITETATFALGDTPANFATMNTLSWTYDGRENINGGDDSEEVLVRIVNGATILAASTSGGTFQRIYIKASGGFSTTDVTRGPTAFSYVNTGASKTTWDGATVEIRRINIKNKGPDNNRPEPDYFAVTGDYTAVSTPSGQQTNFRVRTADTVALNSTTFAAALNVNPSPVDVFGGDVTIRLRFEVDEINSFDLTQAYQLRVSKNSAAYAVPASVSGVTSVNSSQYTDGDATTDILSGSGRTFQAGEGVGSDNVTGTITALNNEHTELEFCVRLDSASLANNDTLDFRVYTSSGAALVGGYTNTPRITISKTAPTPVFEQADYRIYADDVSESGSTPLNDQSRSAVIDKDTPAQIRFLIRNSGDSATFDPKLQYRYWIEGTGAQVNPTAWADVTATSDRVNAVASAVLTDNGATTERLGGAGTFVAGKIDTGDGQFNSGITVGNGQDTEVVFVVELDSTDLASDQEEFQFRLVNRSDGALYDTYSVDPFLNPTLVWEHGFEGGTDGNDVNTTVADPDTIDGIQNGAGVLTYSDITPFDGSMGASVVYTAGGTAAHKIRWYDLNQASVCYWRFYVRYNSLPSADHRIGQATEHTDLVTPFALHLNASNQWQLRDDTGVIATATSAISAATWYRVEIKIVPETVTGAGDGTLLLRYYDADAGDTTLIQEIGLTGTAVTGTELEDIDFGVFSNVTQSWGIDAMAVGNTDWIGPAVAGTSITHTTDAVLQKIDTKTHITDALLKATETLTHTTDAVLVDTFTRDHTSDAVLQTTETRTHTSDVVLVNRQIQAHSTDALLVSVGTQTHTADAYLVDRLTVAHTSDAILQATATVAHSTDVVTVDRLTTTHATDALLTIVQATIHTTDAWLVDRQTVAHTSDALLQKTSIVGGGLWLSKDTNGASTPDSAALSVSGDHDIRVRIAANDYASGNFQHLITKDDITSNRSYYLRITTGGFLEFRHFGNWTEGDQPVSTAFIPAADGQKIWLRAAMDADDGSGGADIAFYYSFDDTNDDQAVSWTQLGSVRHSTTTVSVADTNAEFEVGTQNGTNDFDGVFLRAVMYSDISETTKVFDADFTTLTPGEIAAGFFVEDSPEAATVTMVGIGWSVGTHATDASLVDRRTAIHSTDALLQATSQVIHDSDALLVDRLTVDHSADAILRETITASHTTNALLETQGAATHSTDALLQATSTESHSTDAYVQATKVRNHTTDASLVDRQVVTHSTNALLQSTVATTHQSDVFLVDRAVETHATDALLLAVEVSVHTSDALLQATLLRSHSTDAFLFGAGSVSHASDALLQATITATHSTDAFLVGRLTVDHTSDTVAVDRLTVTHASDGYLVVQSTITHSTDAVLQATVSLTHSTDALLEQAGAVTHSTDALLIATVTVDHSTDARTVDRLTETHTSDAFLSAGVELVHTADAFLILRSTVTHSTDAIATSVLAVAHSTDALLQATVAVSHSTDAVVVSRLALTHASDALLQASVATSHASDAYLVGRLTLAHSSDATLQATVSRTHTTNAFLEAQGAIVHTADAVLQGTSTVDHSTDAILLSTSTLVHTSDGFLELNIALDHSTDAVLQATSSRTHSSDALLQASESVTHFTDALLLLSTLLTHTSDGFLQSTVTLAFTSDAILRSTVALTHTSDAQIVVTVSHTSDALLEATPTVSHTSDAVKAFIGLVTDLRNPRRYGSQGRDYGSRSRDYGEKGRDYR